MAQLNSYQIYWAELTPNKGIVTIRDRKAFGDMSCLGTEKKHYKHFANKEKAIDWINGFSKKLDKQYTVRLFTDKQFSMSETRNGEIIIPFTKKQLEEVYKLN